ncbi:DEKNAAC105395 [Brettanomyces naardenensis]|uniref:DEKNAAC105395 n=1 Tax=Brettanomyces naardenensis TaxID=13370 RepID=A0A448YTJ3_BRENA|nr:DEKNAAC105395 [Brettanomyces naardenensis]
MKATLQTLAKEFSPLIKFVGGPHPIPKNVVITAHPCAPNNLLPIKVVAVKGPAVIVGPFQSRNSLSQRFRYRAIDELEIADVESGGAELIN